MVIEIDMETVKDDIEISLKGLSKGIVISIPCGSNGWIELSKDGKTRTLNSGDLEDLSHQDE